MTQFNLAFKIHFNRFRTIATKSHSRMVQGHDMKALHRSPFRTNRQSLRYAFWVIGLFRQGLQIIRPFALEAGSPVTQSRCDCGGFLPPDLGEIGGQFFAIRLPFELFSRSNANPLLNAPRNDSNYQLFLNTCLVSISTTTLPSPPSICMREYLRDHPNCRNWISCLMQCKRRTCPS